MILPLFASTHCLSPPCHSPPHFPHTYAFSLSSHLTSLSHSSRTVCFCCCFCLKLPFHKSHIFLTNPHILQVSDYMTVSLGRLSDPQISNSQVLFLCLQSSTQEAPGIPTIIPRLSVSSPRTFSLCPAGSASLFTTVSPTSGVVPGDGR